MRQTGNIGGVQDIAATKKKRARKGRERAERQWSVCGGEGGAVRLSARPD